MSVTSIIFDLVVLAIFISCVVYYSVKGFVASIVNLVGTVVSLIVSFVLSSWLSRLIFSSWIREGMITRTMQVLTDKSVSTIDQLLNSVLDFLPQPMVESLMGSHTGALQDASRQFATTIVDTIIAPPLISLIGIVVFILAFLLVRLLFKALGKMLTGINRIPLVGTVNKALGAVSGLIISAVYVFLLLCVVWTIDAAYGSREFSETYFGDSFVYKLTLPLDIYETGVVNVEDLQG